MPDKIPFKCKRCSTAWERTVAELNAPDVTVYRGDEPKKYTYRDNCPSCGTVAITEAREPGGEHA